MHRIKGYTSNVLWDEYPVLRQAAESVDAVILVFDGWHCLSGNLQALLRAPDQKRPFNPRLKPWDFWLDNRQAFSVSVA
jgi:hypothetical protein